MNDEALIIEPLSQQKTEGEKETSLRTQGQRDINEKWETVQAKIALLVTRTAMATVFMLQIMAFILLFLEHPEKSVQLVTISLQLLTSAVFLIIGFYFSRTNHQKTGGIGLNDLGR
jgi:cation transport ATPase